MTLIVVSIVATVILQFVLWVIVKRFRTNAEGATPIVERRAARTDLALWLVAAIVIVVSLVLFARIVYDRQRTLREDAPDREAHFIVSDVSIV